MCLNCLSHSLRKMKHHLTILHAGITRFKHFMYKQQEEGKLKNNVL